MATTTRTTRTAPASRKADPEPEAPLDEDIDPDQGALDEDDLFDENDVEDDDDDLEGARSGYLTFDDLLGRLLVIKPASIGTRPSKQKGQDDYEYVVCETMAVLDGDETDIITELPHIEEDFQMWGVNVVSTLKPKIRSGKWVVGRLAQRRAKGFTTMAWFLEEPSEDDFAEAKEWLREFKADQRERAAAKRRR